MWSAIGVLLRSNPAQVLQLLLCEQRALKATDRQRQLLSIISHLQNCDEEFSVLDIVTGAKSTRQPFSPSHVNQMLGNLSNAGLIYKNRHGRYAFAMPLLGQFIRRQEKEEQQLRLPFDIKES